MPPGQAAAVTGDRIRLVGATFYGYHGVQPEERQLGRPFRVDLEMTLDLSAAGKHDDLAKTVDYGQVYRMIRQVGESQKFLLLEALAEEIARRALSEFPMERVTVRVTKPDPPVGGVLEAVQVEITRPKL